MDQETRAEPRAESEAATSLAAMTDKDSGAKRDAEAEPTEMRRILHEAAWSRMFGKATERNPFAR